VRCQGTLGFERDQAQQMTGRPTVTTPPARSRRYHAPPEALRTITVLLVLRD